MFLFSGCATVERPAVQEFSYPSERAYTHFSLGSSYSRNMAPEAAIGEFKLALKADPDSVLIRQALADEYIKGNKTGEAILVLQDLYSKNKNPEAGVSLAKIYLEDDKPVQALEILENIIKASPKNSPAYFYLGNTFFRLDRQDEAVFAFKKSAENDPGNEATYYNLGLVLSKKTDLAGAEKAYLKAVELDPAYVSAQYALGLLYQFLSRYNEALERYRTVENLTPYDERVFVRIATTLSQLNRNDESIQYLNKASAISPDDADPYYRLSLIYRRLKNGKDALLAINKALELDGGNGEILQVKGVIQLENGDTEGALQTFTGLTVKAPEEAAGYLYLYLSYLYNKKKAVKAAVSVLEQGVARLPSNTDLKLYLGGAYLDSKDYDRAELQYRALLLLQPEDARGNYYLGVCCERKKNYNEAFIRFRNTIQSDPQNADALNYLGFMYADRGENLEEAYTFLKKACEIEPGNGAFVDSLGWVLYKLGRNDEARIKTEESVKLLKNNGQEDSVVFEHLGDIYLKGAANEKAKELYGLSVKTDPGNENAKKKLKQLQTPAR